MGCTCIENSLQWAYACLFKPCDGLGELSVTVIEIGGDLNWAEESNSLTFKFLRSLVLLVVLPICSLPSLV